RRVVDAVGMLVQQYPRLHRVHDGTHFFVDSPLIRRQPRTIVEDLAHRVAADARQTFTLVVFYGDVVSRTFPNRKALADVRHHRTLGDIDIDIPVSGRGTIIQPALHPDDTLPILNITRQQKGLVVVVSIYPPPQHH